MSAPLPAAPPLAVDLRAGILGGGQLARMLAEAGARLGLHMVVLADERDAPAAQVARDVVVGRIDEEPAVRELFARSHVVVFENEFVDTALIERAMAGSSASVSPSPAAIATGQDKLRQKDLLARLGIPTAPHVRREDEGAEAFVARALERFRAGAVFKWALLGYDGKGVLAAGPSEAARAVEFCREAISKGRPLYAEELIPFRREIALVASYSTLGEFQAFPLVVTEQSSGVCCRAYGPAAACGVSVADEAAARRHARRLAQALGLIGTFAIEMFETDRGGLLVNEIAPRVHNSGHFTLDAAATSQFENHWRAVLGQRLGETYSAPGFAMENLLGPTGVVRPACGAPLPRPMERVRLHWYGKREIRPGRKLGHLNGAVAAADRLPSLLDELAAARIGWEEALRSSPSPRR